MKCHLDLKNKSFKNLEAIVKKLIFNILVLICLVTTNSLLVKFSLLC